MKSNVILFYILSLIFCSPPPEPQPVYQIYTEESPLIIKDNIGSSLKNLEGDAKQYVSNVIDVITCSDDGQIEEKSLRITTINLGDNSFLATYSFSINLPEGQSLELITNSCTKVKESDGELTNEDCSSDLTQDGQKYTFTYNYKLYKEESININYKIKIKKNVKEILYKQESISIPKMYPDATCNYTFIIPDNYVSLGLKNNLLNKESQNKYTYTGDCPKDEAISDVIRFTPKESLWKAETSFILESSSEIDENVTLTFPRYYKGGKIKNKIFKIFSYEKEELKESDLIIDEKLLKVELPGKNNKKIGVDLYTSFSNKLNDDFSVYFSEDKYQINEGNIDGEIKAKAEEIINDANSKYKDYPNYYKIGQFVFSHIQYDLNNKGKDFTPLQIYQQKKGVCEHYTILYNAMLNAIGIKTLYISGWAFDKNVISGNKNTLGHAWTAALIGDKWMELDATWGLFEGIPAGHILKNFDKETFSFQPKSQMTMTLTKELSIQLVDNIDISDDEIIKDLDINHGTETKDDENPNEKGDEKSNEKNNESSENNKVFNEESESGNTDNANGSTNTEISRMILIIYLLNLLL